MYVLSISCFGVWCSKHFSTIMNVVLENAQTHQFLKADTTTLFYKEGNWFREVKRLAQGHTATSRATEAKLLIHTKFFHIALLLMNNY